jgi:hypothetical protein
VIAGGLVQALLLLAVGQVARGVHDVRVAVQAR